MAIPDNITKEHLQKAIDKIELEGIPMDGDSQYYDVNYNGKKYPPKVIVSYANLFANGVILDRTSFSGGIDTPCFKLLQQNGFIIINKEMKLNKEVVKEIVTLCETMSEGRANGSINQNTYSEKFKPFLKKFKDTYGESPNLLLQNELRQFYNSNFKNISSKIEYKSFGYWGRSIYNYTWACIYYDYGKDAIPASFSPQLYILVNRMGIKFGFCYGQHVENDAEMITSVLSEKKFLVLKKSIENDRGLYFFNSKKNEITASPEKLFGKDERVIVNTDEDIRKNWSNSSLLIKEFRKDDIPDNIGEIIQSTLVNLKEFYLKLLPLETIIKQENYHKTTYQIPFV